MHTLSRPGREDIISRLGHLKQLETSSHKQRLYNIPAPWSYHSSVPSQVFLTNASTAMWGSSKPEGVNVSLDLLQICVMTEKKQDSIIISCSWHSLTKMYCIYHQHKKH